MTILTSHQLQRRGINTGENFANSIIQRFSLSENDMVVDIGSNVGTLLSKFKNNGIKVQGVDPAANIVLIAQSLGIDTICFFNEECVQK